MRLSAKPLTKEETNEIVQSKLDWILAAVSPIRVILFGSAARGEMTNQSDVDLILLFNEDADLRKMNETLFLMRPKTDLWPQDVILETETTYQMKVARGGGACWIASQEGKIIFERKPL